MDCTGESSNVAFTTSPNLMYIGLIYSLNTAKHCWYLNATILYKNIVILIIGNVTDTTSFPEWSKQVYYYYYYYLICCCYYFTLEYVWRRILGKYKFLWKWYIGGVVNFTDTISFRKLSKKFNKTLSRI